MSATQTAQPGQSGIATASELDQHGNPFTIPDPNVLVWSASDPSISVAPVGDGTPTAKVSVSTTSPVGTYTITFADPDAPSLVVTAGTLNVVAAVAVATTGAVDLGTFS